MRIPLLLCSICCAATALAQDAVPSAAERQALREKSQALRAKADEMRNAAEQTALAESKACWKKFLVTACQDEAKLKKQRTLAEARAIDKEGRDIERALRRVEFEEREKQRIEEAPQRAADAAAQAEKNRLEQQEAMERVEKKRLEAEQRDKR